ncbi:MAG: hypothetical protein GEV07_02895 [Streptosporangiales bacterium]|nr:hypothetical protein [Streptosporangiales bacterium]
MRTFLWHYVEMVIAMAVGMLLLGPVWDTAGFLLGGERLLARPDAAALVMAADMTIGMAVWMRYRRHGWRGIAEMGAAMFLPFVVLLVPCWAGVVSGEALLMGGHMLMLPAMAVAMLLRRGEYTRRQQHAPAPDHSDAMGRGRRIRAFLVRRWPTWLALVLTVDNWVQPGVPSPWLMLLLPAAYLVIGGVRKQFGDRRMLALQLGGLLVYVLLVAVAVTADDWLVRYLVAAGWLFHAGWDIAHHRARAVVPRAYAEWCAVVDAVIGITVLLLWP